MGTGVVTFAFALSSSFLDLKAKSGHLYVLTLTSPIRKGNRRRSMVNKLTTLIVAIFAVFVVQLIDGTQMAGDKLQFKNNGVFVYEVNDDKASTEISRLIGYVPNVMIRSIERVE